VQVDKEKAKHITTEFVRAIETFSKDHVGALIVLEQQTALADISETGTVLDAEVSAELLGNIFYVGSPLHDGAVLVRGDRMLAAGCVLPLSQNKTIGKELGTRHRAAIGMTEHSDAIVLVVSEESGVISMAQQGKLSRFLEAKTIEKTLLNMYLNKQEINGGISFFQRLFRKIKGEKDAEK
jgi:diadenylate cyclase